MECVNDLVKKEGLEYKLKKYNKGLTELVEVEIPIVDFELQKPSSRFKLNLGYGIQEDPIYLKGVYLSILSQIANTDLPSIGNIVLFTSDSYFDIVKNLFSNIEEELDTLTIYYQDEFRGDWGKSYKMTRQALLTHGQLRYEGPYVTPSEFSFFKSSPENFYRKIYKKFEEKECVVGSFFEKENSFVLKEGKENDMFYDESEAFSFFKKRINLSRRSYIKNIIKRKTWFSNSLFGFSEATLNQRSDYWQEWKNYLKWMEFYQIKNFSLVIAPFLIKKDIRPVFLKDFINEDKLDILILNEFNPSKSYLSNEVSKIIKELK